MCIRDRPNGAMSSGVITNYSKLDTRRIEWNFGVDYGCLLYTSFRQMAALSLLRLHVTPEGSNGILTVSAIGIAVRLRLRTRLTLIRLALIRKPCLLYTSRCV